MGRPVCLTGRLGGLCPQDAVGVSGKLAFGLVGHCVFERRRVEDLGGYVVVQGVDNHAANGATGLVGGIAARGAIRDRLRLGCRFVGLR